jgi:hypothetical protein
MPASNRINQGAPPRSYSYHTQRWSIPYSFSPKRALPEQSEQEGASADGFLSCVTSLVEWSSFHQSKKIKQH